MSIYLKAFVISILIFLLGILVGLSIERFFVSDLSSRASSIENSVQEIELEMLYFQSFDDYSCEFINEIIRKTNNELDELADKLLGYSETSVLFTGEQIKNIKRKYTFLLIKDWLLQERVKRSCGTGTVTILYFYDTEGCNDCLVQGDVLTALKNRFKDKVMIFPLDANMDVEMVNILMNRFNVTSTPSIVIDEKTYTGIVDMYRLNGMVCERIEDSACQ